MTEEIVNLIAELRHHSRKLNCTNGADYACGNPYAYRHHQEHPCDNCRTQRFFARVEKALREK